MAIKVAGSNPNSIRFSEPSRFEVETADANCTGQVPWTKAQKRAIALAWFKGEATDIWAVEDWIAAAAIRAGLIKANVDDDGDYLVGMTEGEFAARIISNIR